MTTVNIDSMAKALTSYAGRDKALRSLAFYLQLYAQSHEKKAEIMALAKQLSGARLVGRQFNHPSMFKACQQVVQALRSGNTGDRIEFGTGAAVTGIYTVYGFVELFAWLSDAKLLSYDSARLWRWSLYLWIAALTCGIIRQLRVIQRRSTKGFEMEKSREDVITTVGLSCDLISAINSLPHKFLWAGKLSIRQSATFSLIASLIGFYKVY